jgi:hypothetical protein
MNEEPIYLWKAIADYLDENRYPEPKYRRLLFPVYLFTLSILFHSADGALERQ